MQVERISQEKLQKLFKNYDTAPDARTKIYEMMNIEKEFHKHCLEKIEIILAIAGEMQKHFKEL